MLKTCADPVTTLTIKHPHQPNTSVLDSLPIILVMATASLLLIFPIQDYDIFWHLANGRAMLDRGSIINQEIFSFTANGNTFNNHAWLAQVLFSWIYNAFGPNGLISSKIILCLATLYFLYALGKKHNMSSPLTSLVCLLVIGASLFRYVVRPHLFSYFLLSLLAYILFSYSSKKHSKKLLTLIPFIIAIWDILHGAVYGVLFLALFGVAECIKTFFSQYLPHSNTSDSRTDHKALWLCLAATLALSLINPYGLRSYDIFVEFINSNLMTSMTAEFQPTSIKDHPLFLLLMAATLVALSLNWRQLDLTKLLIFLAFSFLSIRYVRAIGPFSIIAGSIIMTTLPSHTVCKERSWRDPTNIVLLCILAAGIGYALHYKFSLPARYNSLGLGISQHAYPSGSTRFVKKTNITGNMYNTDRFGGYLSYFLYPDRLIFHYNHHMLFNALERFVHDQNSREKWQINYAIIGRADEWEMFERDGFVAIYWEPTAAVMVRNNQHSKKIINRYAIKYFSPIQSKEQFMALAANKTILPRLVLETANYLQYRNDKRIASIFAAIINFPNQSLSTEEKIALLKATFEHNPNNSELLGALGNLYYTNGQITEATKQIRLALAIDNNLIQALYTQAYILYDQKQYEHAINNFQKILTQLPRHPDSHYGMGLSYYKLGQYKQAKSSWVTYLQLVPSGQWADQARALLQTLSEQSSSGNTY